MKNILVVGGGGREHAICAAFKKSKKVGKLFCAPGNAGISEIAEVVPIKATECEKIVDFALEHKIELVFVAPDDPLAMGLVNMLQANNIRAFGPTKEAAIIEASKAFSKAFMKRHNIPTADYNVFYDFEKATEYVKNAVHPLVIKADGLALGKGVLICNTVSESEKALSDIMVNKVFGTAGNGVIIEEFLTGKEFTLLAFTDGKTVKCMPASQDHKKAFDGDKGLNTGGMGAFAPTKTYSTQVQEETLKKIVYPTIKGLNEENRKFKGVIYYGLMLTEKGVKVIEYNARFGDPETQVVLPLLKTDLLDIAEAVIDEKLDKTEIEWIDSTALTVVIASGGYPENVIKGYEIAISNLSNNVILYHSGTAFSSDRKLITNGGRVLCLTAVADSIDDARKAVYAEIDKISFTNSRYRTDIGIK